MGRTRRMPPPRGSKSVGPSVPRRTRWRHSRSIRGARNSSSRSSASDGGLENPVPHRRHGKRPHSPRTLRNLDPKQRVRHIPAAARWPPENPALLPAGRGTGRSSRRLPHDIRGSPPPARRPHADSPDRARTRPENSPPRRRCSREETRQRPRNQLMRRRSSAPMRSSALPGENFVVGESGKKVAIPPD